MQDVRTWNGMKVRDVDGERIGHVQDVFLDRLTGEPAWATVKTGLFGATGLGGLKTAFVPLGDAKREDEHHVRLAVHRDEVKHAPRLAAGQELSRDEERRLFEYYKRADYDDWTDATRGRLERVA